MKKVIEHGAYFRLTCKDCGCIFEIENPEKEMGQMEKVIFSEHVLIVQGISCPECNSINNIRKQKILINMNFCQNAWELDGK